MGRILNLSLDLGRDSLKIAFAYSKRNDGRVTSDADIVYGKFGAPGYTLKIGFPAIASHDEELGAWTFGDKADREFGSSFGRIVRIKDLLSLLNYEASAPYYSTKTHFPRFFFPAPRDYKLIENFSDSVAFGDTFDGGITPKALCGKFFEYVATTVAKRISELSKSRGVVFDGIKLAVIYPPKVNKKYITELSELVESSFGRAPEKVLSTTKSLGMYAKHRQILKNGACGLIVDMGEEDVSVAKVAVAAYVSVDGQEGHSEPLAIGGNDFDYAVAEMLKAKICNRIPFGVFPADGEDFEHEEPLYEMQYLFMKSIKSAKVALSRDGGERGASVGIHYETYKQGTLTRADVERCLGTNTPYTKRCDTAKIAPKIARYIIDELKRPVNRDIVTPPDGTSYGKVILAGGLAECYSLKQYIAKAVALEFPKIGTVAFEESEDSSDELNVQSFEDSAYAPAVGGALVALKNEDVRTVLSFSYARISGGTCKKTGVYHHIFSIFVEKGTPVEEGKKFITAFNFRVMNESAAAVNKYLTPCVSHEAIYSIDITSHHVSNPAVGEDEIYTRTYRGKTVRCIRWFGISRLVLGDTNMRKEDFPKSELAPLVGAEAKTFGKLQVSGIYLNSATGKKTYEPIDRIMKADSEPDLYPLNVVASLTVDYKGYLTAHYDVNKSLQQGKEYKAHFAKDPAGVYRTVKISELKIECVGLKSIKASVNE